MPKSSITVRDVAEAAGVSKTTAVYVLNDAPHLKVPPATRERVLMAARRLGYRRNGVAAALSRGRLHTVGLVVDRFRPEDTGPLDNVYAKDVLSAVTGVAAEAGLRMTVMAVRPDSLPPVEEVVDRRVDGLILISMQDDDFARALYATGFPCVSIGSGYAERRVPVDNRGGAAAAAEHLIGLGHRRFLCAIDLHRTGQASRDRHDGFLEAAGRHGLRLGGAVMVAPPRDAPEMLRSLPLAERPTAVFAFNDQDAWQIVRRVRALGMEVPRDLSVVGYDNNILAETCVPPLTTVVNPLRAQAEAALQVLQALWRGEQDVPQPDTIPMTLVVRESTGPPPTLPDFSEEGEP